MGRFEWAGERVVFPEPYPFEDALTNAPANLDAAIIDEVGHAGTPLRKWPLDLRTLYREEVVRRILREEHFLFLLGLLVCLSTVVVDLIVAPDMAREGAVLRVLAIAPVTLFGLFAASRRWHNILAFCVGAAPIGFIAAILHLSLHLPPDYAARYLLATSLVVGLGNIILPYSMRGLVIFDLCAFAAALASIAVGGSDAILQHLDFLVVLLLVVAATLPVAARMERLRQHNFLLNLRARIVSDNLVEANRALVTLSETDPLTGIANRRRFEREFEQAILAPGTTGRRCDFIALMMIDLDHFKSFNDTHGHQAGDSCLKLVAQALVDLFAAHGGIVARYGGEEFIAAIRGRTADAALTVAELARQTVATALMPMSDSERSLVTASIGVGVAPVAAMLPREELIEMADAALYSGKGSGRNRVEVVEAEAAFGITA